MKCVIIMGSARSDGNTSTVVQYLSQHLQSQIIDLNDFQIDSYNYKHDTNDDFIQLMEKVLFQYDCIVLATPVYWYSMSGTMKNFVDRFTDLLKIRKDLGRKLRGKSLAVLSCSGHDDQKTYFWEPFKLTAKYLGMKYLGDIHSVVENDMIPNEIKLRLEGFAYNIRTALDS